jgi:DNA-binding transcriptional regulator GbsR (MarR family)
MMGQALEALSLDVATVALIEKFGLFMSSMGLPPSVSRVMGLLLVCEPRYQSAEAVQQLKLSSGSVSSAMFTLQQLGFTRKMTFPEDQHFYYELDPDWWQKRQHQMKEGVALAEEGLALSKNNIRLKDMRRLYQAFGKFLEGLESQ